MMKSTSAPRWQVTYLACPGGTSAQCTPRTTSRAEVEVLIWAIRRG
jgi:hypothetical protein